MRAFFATTPDIFAVAKVFGAMHNDGAFQASSPKTFQADPSGSAIFFNFCDRRFLIRDELKKVAHGDHSFVALITLQNRRCGRDNDI
jgi:hypothetical protein